MNNQVRIGSAVEVELQGKILRFTIVRKDGKPDEGIISAKAPIAKAILNGREGETREYAVGQRTFTVTILRIASS